MKNKFFTSMKLILIGFTFMGFLSSYFGGLIMTNAEQFLCTAVVILLDGLFGIIAGIKREGFKTYKALKILKSLFVWEVILAVILLVERAFHIDWLSSTVLMPFIVFEIISVLKNASIANLIKSELVNKILSNIDNHKDLQGSTDTKENDSKTE